MTDDEGRKNTIITEEIFEAFLYCETKSYLKFSNVVGLDAEFTDWQRRHVENYKQVCLPHLRSRFQEEQVFESIPFSQVLENGNCRLAIDCIVQTDEIQTCIHALERVSDSESTKHNSYIPMRLVPREKITKQDKLMLAFDSLALSLVTGKMLPFGKIIHGNKQTSIKTQLASLMEIIRLVVERITAQQASETVPQLILNRHCAECEFRTRCRQIAMEKDELTLLSNMTEKERKKQYERGIFSVTQLSYTFRPRRKPRRSISKPEKFSHALRALAIRERKIHISGRPNLTLKGNPVYLDVEGIPDRNFYYLIGLRVKIDDSYIQYSFWASDEREEKDIWANFLRTLAIIDNPQLVHYGNYEKIFFSRMKARYPEINGSFIFLDQLIADSVNVLSTIYSQIYFPTFSNSLKEIARHLGFDWTEVAADGLHSLVWRFEWELSKDSTLKQKLVTYNTEDCVALERVAIIVAQLSQREMAIERSSDCNIVDVDSLKRASPYRLGKNEFVMPEMEYINQCAYWDYQREKIYVRSSRQLRRFSKKDSRGSVMALAMDELVESLPSDSCSRCSSKRIVKYGKKSRVIYDLKFGEASVERRIVKFVLQTYLCYECNARFYPRQRSMARSKFGHGLLVYLMYQIIELRLPHQLAAQNLNQLFGFNLHLRVVTHQKTRASRLYKDAYERILDNILSGGLLHADETRVNIYGEIAYVWVITNMEEVAYFYTKTREADKLQELLKEFKGVLVSDFYAAYDSINCPQQKCLIHLMRDLNDDLLEQPFNDELKELVQKFTMLLKPMIETIDRFGLKMHFLQKHKVFVESFYIWLSEREYKTEIAIKNRKRFEKNRNKLFTFLDYDDVPWNNNNAECAIKAFAALRKVIGGTSSEKGIQEYLVLLSICETCKYKGVSFLDFLRSGENDIDTFVRKSDGQSDT